MSGFDFDLFVIGGGSGGVRAARMAAQRGARVALAEAQGRSGLGGTCVNVGCIPKKLYHYAAHYAEAAEEARGYGWHGPAPALDWGELKRRRAAEIARLNGVYETLLRNAGVTLLDGWARLLDAHTVQLATLHADGSPAHQTWRAERILIATGGAPYVPHFQGREHVITSNEVFDLEPLPARLVVVGGGYIACEFASIFLGLGVRVTQLYRGEQILRGFDDEVRHFLADELRKKGLDLRLQTGVVAVQRRDDGLHVQLEDGGHVVADAVLYATGRVPNVAGLGLEQLGVAQGAQGAILVDEHFRTNVPSVYAVGDVVARAQLTPVALAEAMAVVDHLFGPPAGAAPRQARYDLIPTAVFTLPSVGAVGLTEAQARQQGRRLRIYRSAFRPLRHTLSGRDERALVKLVVDDASDQVLGLHMVGPEAGEIVQGFAVALRCGATKAQFDATLGIHPTLAEEFVTLREPASVG
ncbi:Glutathione amide reductase [Tepidimonas alkaliphilus]|uniref:Glutathione amide reductase n=1 Tax=Tepidimonas alkaliphilus TaxID=2588942 RepID=A0A554W7F2_9BURK|nr:glutathione-disulfide reductase [Tepidimonas alkaliphilus]TSE19499.1 Glutathione amide reductase [Tepidimonas alkaliphilus]